jgi:hypothetical protein
VIACLQDQATARNDPDQGLRCERTTREEQSKDWRAKVTDKGATHAQQQREHSPTREDYRRQGLASTRQKNPLSRTEGNPEAHRNQHSGCGNVKQKRTWQIKQVRPPVEGRDRHC